MVHGLSTTQEFRKLPNFALMKGNKTSAAASFPPLSTIDYVNLVIIGLYLMLEFIPKGDAIDYNGPQWLFLSILNLCVIVYLYFGNRTRHNDYDTQFSNTITRAPVLVYGLFFLIAGISFFSAFNVFEFYIGYTRLAIALIGFVNLLLVFQKTEKLFPYIAQVIAFIMFIQCIEAMQAFLSDIGVNGIVSAVLSMRGNTGNKDVFAAGVLIKAPFVLYGLYNGKRLFRIINFVILTFVLYTLFVSNTRSVFVGLVAEVIVYFVFCIYDYASHKDGRNLVKKLGFFVLPLVISIVLAQITIDTQRRIAPVTGSTGNFGTVTERISTINLSDTGTSGRSNIWRASIALFKDHPVRGVGFGNWKISSIPYERFYNDDNAISVHSHNDFLEVLGETGIFGGVVYLLLFLVIPIVSFRNLFAKTISNDNKVILTISLIGIAAYFCDSLFNFPLERATMQLYFIILLALNISENYRLSVLNAPTTKKVAGNRLRIYLALAAICMVPAIYVSNQNLQSMIVQNTVFDDVNADIMAHKSYEVNDLFPPMPNVTMWGLPISVIKGRYLIAENRFTEGVAMLENVAKENPYLYYAEFVKGKMYFETKQFDSAYKYSIIAFDNRPRNLAYFGLLAFTCANKQDSIRIKKAFQTFRKYRKDVLVAGAWNNYLYALTVMKYPVPYMLKVADSALALYPQDSVSINNSRAMHQMAGDTTVTGSTTTAQALAGPSQAIQLPGQAPQNPGAPPQGNFKDSAIFYDVFKRGNDAFVKSDFKNAIDLYEKALKINPTFYAAMENIGLSYFLMQNYGTAVRYLEMGIANKGAVDGKAEYFRGIALINMGRRDEGCQSFLVSEGKKYYDARRLYDLNCNLPATPPNQ